MSTISRTVYSKAGCVSCGTIAMRRATVARDMALMAVPSRRTTPASGWSTPASILSSVVLPDPFGPSMPTDSPRSMDRLTSSRTAVRELLPWYAKRRLPADSNADPNRPGAPQGRVPKDFLVGAIEQVGAARKDLDDAMYAE